jgi:hypothetical protein
MTSMLIAASFSLMALIGDGGDGRCGGDGGGEDTRNNTV